MNDTTRLTALSLVAALALGCGADDEPTAGDQAHDTPESVGGTVPLCEDVPELTTDVIGDGSPHGPGSTFIGVVLTYFADKPGVHQGGWIDHDAGGTYVVLVTEGAEIHREALARRAPSPGDVPAVEPPPTITDTRPIGERDVAWDVVEVERSREEIMAATDGIWDVLESAGIGISVSSVDIQRGRLSLGIIEPTEQTLVDVAGLVDPDLVCVEGPLVDPGRTVPQPGDDLDVIPPGGEPTAATLVSCGWADSFPLSTILDPRPLGDEPDLAAGLQAYLQTTPTVPGAGTSDDFFILEAGEDEATVISSGGHRIQLRRSQVGWRFVSSGGCGLRTALPEGLGGVDWRLDPDVPAPTPESTEIALLVSEGACASGQPPGDRLLGPQVVETETEVLIAFAAITLQGEQTCPANPEEPVTIQLAAPLGDRELVDGVRLDLDVSTLLGR